MRSWSFVFSNARNTRPTSSHLEHIMVVLLSGARYLLDRVPIERLRIFLKWSYTQSIACAFLSIIA
mgnify:CR=1 FL=1|eukprot:scaffold58689_cov36-Tisochrysis_lutea.AAC.3